MYYNVGNICKVKLCKITHDGVMCRKVLPNLKTSNKLDIYRKDRQFQEGIYCKLADYFMSNFF